METEHHTNHPTERPANMKAINQNARRILDALTADLEPATRSNNSHRKVDNATGAYMAVSVEYLEDSPDGAVYSVAHYGTQNGDLMADPEMTFFRAADGNYYPLTFRNDYLHLSQEVVARRNHGRIAAYRFRLSRELATFAGEWFRNIKRQQGIKTTRAARV